MKTSFALLIATIGASLHAFAGGQNTSTPGGPAVHMVVSVEARHGANPPAVDQADVLVYESKTRDKVISWIPAQNDRADLDFYILIDDSAGDTLGLQLDPLRKFIDSQPPTTKVGVAYMRDGAAQIAQIPTGDHALSAKSLRLPIGVPGINASPYFSLSDLIKHWPQSSARREVLMVTDGIDRFYGTGDAQDPYLDSTIRDAQQAGVIVYAIYNPDTGHFGHSYWRTYWGQLYLSQLTDETGGESYQVGFTGPAVNFAPFLQSVSTHLMNQYWLTFAARPEKKGAMQRVKLTTETPNAELVGADRVYVPASQ